MAKRELIAGALVLAFVCATLLSPAAANELFSAVKDGVVTHFDRFLTTSTSLCLLLMLGIALVPRFNVRLGAADARPEFSTLSWFAMLVSAGLASGVLYWATAEPITHFQGNPHLDRANLAPLTEAAAQQAVTLTIFHWGLHGWGFYALTGLSIAFFAYRHGHSLSLSGGLLAPSADGSTRPLGVAVDLLGVLGTVFGVATSMGLAVGGMNAAIGELTGLAISSANQILILALVTGLGIVSVVLGLRRGIARLSQLNVVLSVALLLAVLLLGPTAFLLGFIFSSLADYAASVIPLGFWTANAQAASDWQSAWTVFYWGWWLSWAPFVGLFIARISRGRTVREFILGVLLLPTLAVVAWMSIFGGVALREELAGTGTMIDAINADYAQGTVAMVQQLDAFTVPLLILMALLLFSWLITSLDSATLVLCTLLEQPDSAEANAATRPNLWRKALWGSALGLVTAALLIAGGLDALQSASIIAGLPLALVLIAMGVRLVLGLWRTGAIAAPRARTN